MRSSRSAGGFVRGVRLSCRRALAGVMAASGLLTTAHGASAGSLGGPLRLADEGSFFIGGKTITTRHAAPSGAQPAAEGSITVNQMYVHYRIPETGNGVPLVLVHGANHSGQTFETTPDGREGWATYFTRKGYSTYVVDHAGRGRSGFDPSPINRTRAEQSTSSLPAIAVGTRQAAWMSYRLGPAYPQFWPDSQFPVEALDHYFMQVVPMAESTLDGEGTNTVEALALLLDRIGPAVVLVHSQSGAYGLQLIRKRPQAVRAFVNVEGDCSPIGEEELKTVFARVPLLSVWGDHSFGFPSRNGDSRRNPCVKTVGDINRAGGKAQFLLLPEISIKGNSHMMMLERNNLAIADRIGDWIARHATKH